MTECISITITFLLNKLSYLKFMFMMALTHLGLLKSPEAPNSPEDHPTSYVLVIEGPNPSILTVQIDVLTSLIKKRLPVVEYSNFLARVGADEDSNDGVCAVCLDSIENSQEIRELRNCFHAFHRKCLDYWIDEGQVTCPLCRSMLFPAKGERLNLHRGQLLFHH